MEYVLYFALIFNMVTGSYNGPVQEPLYIRGSIEMADKSSCEKRLVDIKNAVRGPRSVALGLCVSKRYNNFLR